MNIKHECLTKQIFIECSPQTLFSFFTDPEKMVRWIGRNVLLDPSVGGKYRIDINGLDIAIGEFKEIKPFEKVVWTWGWADSDIMPPGSSTVEFTLTPQNNGTLLVLHHYNLPTEKAKSNSNGWTHYMERLQMLAEGKDPGVDPWSIKK
ncbi:SRPBCC family protein [Metabacillus sp. RGM 3146]|uniref:SRPBCC family protein n=1 Tax=Metabacillus sp. RGM 3146 TaxID=3401092 RepID=UPI003B9CA5C7